MVSKAVGNPISIGTINASWHVLQSHLTLANVVIHNKDGQTTLTLPRVPTTVSWRSLLVGSIRLASLEIDKPDLQIQRDAQDNLFIAGILINVKDQNDRSGSEWLLAQHRIVIRDGRLHWHDDLRKAPELTLTNIDLLLQNRWHTVINCRCGKHRRQHLPGRWICGPISSIRRSPASYQTSAAGGGRCTPICN